MTGKNWVGSELKGRSLGKLDWSQAAFVVVSSDSVNPCGHALLYVGGGFGHYFHVPGLPRFYERPFYFSGSDYQRYLSSGGTREVGRKSIAIPCPANAEAKLYELMEKKWTYLLLPSNCVSFIDSVARAGGNFWDMSNCPRAEPLAWEWLQRKVVSHFVIPAAQCAVVK